MGVTEGPAGPVGGCGGVPGSMMSGALDATDSESDDTTPVILHGVLSPRLVRRRMREDSRMTQYSVFLVDPSDMGGGRNERMSWGELVARLTDVARTPETAEQWAALKAAGLGDRIKGQFGGWVGGESTTGRRDNRSILSRSVLALDVDGASDGLEAEVRALGCAAVLHPSHTPGNWRVVVPLSEDVPAEDYRRLVQALSDRVRGVDPASEKPAQLMFWPSVSVDDGRTAVVIDGEPLDWHRFVRGDGGRREYGSASTTYEQGFDRAALNMALAELYAAPVGARNETLNRVVFSLAVGGAASEQALDAVRAVADQVGLDPGEVGRTIDSALSRGAAEHDSRTEATLGLFEDGRTPVGERPPEPAARAAAAAGPVPVTAAQTVEQGETARPVELWDGCIPIGGVTILSGAGGVGKSTITSWLAAQVTNGTLPGALEGTPANVLMVQSENNWGSTSVPQLQAAGADLGRVYHLEKDRAVVKAGLTSMLATLPGGGSVEARARVDEVRGSEYVIQLPRDRERLLAAVLGCDARLVVLDVVTSMFDEGLDTNSLADVRRVLDPLSEVAQLCGCAIVAIHHWNKGEGANGSRMSGSAAFRDTARCVWLAAKDSESGDVVLLQDKYNASATRREWTLKVAGRLVGDLGWFAAVSAAKPSWGRFQAVASPFRGREVAEALMRVGEGRSHLDGDDLRAVRDRLNEQLGFGLRPHEVAAPLVSLGWHRDRGVEDLLYRRGAELDEVLRVASWSAHAGWHGGPEGPSTPPEGPGEAPALPVSARTVKRLTAGYGEDRRLAVEYENLAALRDLAVGADWAAVRASHPWPGPGARLDPARANAAVGLKAWAHLWRGTPKGAALCRQLE